MKILIIILISSLFIMCSDDNDNDEKDKALTTKGVETHDCDEIVKAIKERDFLSWKGFTDECSLLRMIKPIENWNDIPVRFLGSEYVKAHRVILDIEGYYRPSLAFLEENAILFEAMSPELNTTVEELLQNLGEPTEKLDWVYGSIPFEKGELIYPGRGISLFMNPKHTGIFHIALYAPVELEYYLENLRPKLSKKLK